jgi:hypothetical protein
MDAMAGRGVIAVATLLAVFAAGCGGSSDSGEGTTDGTMTPTTAAPTTTAVGGVGTIAAPTTSVGGSATTPATTTTTTTTVSSATTEPLPVSELILAPGGIGSAAFGADPDAVVEYVTSLLGAPTEDTGWVDPLSFAFCEGTEVRRVKWGVLALLFGDLSTFSSGRRHFFGWEYGQDGQLGLEPVGLRTEGGLTVGAPVVVLRTEFPEVFLNEGDDGGFPSSFYVSDDFRGLLTGVTDDDLVTVMFGGFGCGG